MGGFYYTAKAGDMWDYIAWVVYGNEKMMENMLQAPENREIMSTYIFSAGTKVWCPEAAGEDKKEELPPWRDDE